MDINQVITGELGVKRWQVDAAVKLIDEGNTIPFIARYRKEAGTLDEHNCGTCMKDFVPAQSGRKERTGSGKSSKNRENLPKN